MYHGIYGVATMTISYNIYCDKNYYGPNCTGYCQATYNDTGLYECDEQGNLIYISISNSGIELLRR